MKSVFKVRWKDSSLYAIFEELFIYVKSFNFEEGDMIQKEVNGIYINDEYLMVNTLKLYVHNHTIT